MNAKRKLRALTEEEIDKIIVAQADDDSSWEKPILIHKAKTTTVIGKKRRNADHGHKQP
jgi:hypothetical protein